MSTEYHTMKGEWRIEDIPEDCIIRPSSLKSAFISKKPEIINFLSIAYKEYNHENEGDRYAKADVTEVPTGIVVKDMPNPYGKMYRLVDGKYRIHKLKENGFNASKFYVLQYDEVKPWIWSTVKQEYILRSKFKGQNYLVALFILLFFGILLWRYHRSKRIPIHELDLPILSQNCTRKVVCL